VYADDVDSSITLTRAPAESFSRTESREPIRRQVDERLFDVVRRHRVELDEPV